MTHQIISLVLLCLPALLALISFKLYMVYALALAGIPLGIILPQRVAFESIAGIGGNAVVLFSLILGAFIPLLINPRRWMPYLLKNWFYIFFIAWACLSLFWAPNYIFGFRMLAKISSPLLLLLVMHACIQKTEDIITFERTVFAGCFLLLFFAITNYFIGYSHDLQTINFRNKHVLTAPYTSPAPFSFHLAFGAILAIGKFIQERRKTDLFLFLVFSISVFWAFTRISMVGLIISISLCIFLLTRSKLLKILLPVILSVVFLISIFAFEPMRARMFKNPEKISISDMISNPQKSTSQIHTSGRSYVWGLALNKFFKKNPLIGSGIGATQEWFYGDTGGKQVGVLHSEYLRILCELGIFGIILFVLAMFTYVVLLISIFNKASQTIGQSSKARHYAAIALSSLLFYLITFATDNSIDYVIQLGIFVFGYIGIAIGSHPQEQRLINIKRI